MALKDVVEQHGEINDENCLYHLRACANFFARKMRAKGFFVGADELEEIIGDFALIYARSKKSFNPQVGKSSFQTYLFKGLENQFLRIMTLRARTERQFPHFSIDDSKD